MAEPKFVGKLKINPDGQPCYVLRVKISTSSNGITKYTTTQWSDGELTCNCPGWVIKRGSAERICKHIRQIQKEGVSSMVDPQRAGAEVETPVPPARAASNAVRRARNVHIPNLGAE